jgi:D-arginine dehydrogenase
VSGPARDVDVVVIGGGIAGASAAWHLAATRRVALVEQEAAIGHHATGRSASVLSETSGHPVVCALARASRPFFERPPDDFGPTPLLSPRGVAWVGREEDAERLDRFFDDARRIAPEVERLDATATSALLPGFRHDAIAGGAVHEPDAMSIDTALLLQSFVTGARRRGAALLVSSETVRCEQGVDGTWEVWAGDHRLRCHHVVNAAGAWADVVAERCGVARLGLQPFRRTAALVPAPDRVAAWPLVMDVAARYYLEPEAGGLLISPADETPSEPCDARADELDVAWAIEQVTQATDVPVRTVRSTWAGLRTFAPDRAPVLGEDPTAPGFWWLAGQGGAGIKTAPAMGAILAAQLTARQATTEQATPPPADVPAWVVEAMDPGRFRQA